jgi:HPt (histidine-containing phosphotransfer) domain-containing protein
MSYPDEPTIADVLGAECAKPNWTNLPLEKKYLFQLADGDIDFALELLHLYCQDCTLRIEQLYQACPPLVEAPIYNRLYQSAHYLVGSSANIGDCNLKILAKQLESLAKNNQPADYMTLIHQIQDQITQIQDWLSTA